MHRRARSEAARQRVDAMADRPPARHRVPRALVRVVVVVVVVLVLAAEAEADRADAVGRSVVARILAMPAFLRDHVAQLQRGPPGPEPVETFMSGPALILHWGYPGETHAVQTADGYTLTLFRVPWGRQAGQQAPRPVAFLQHGILQTADQWLMRGPDQDLGLMLADLGFDVWMGNYRGCTYSRHHASLSPRSPRFWDFTWQENALLDLPAMLDYVMAVSGQPSVFYVGHSMGTTTLLALLADRPEYNAHVRAAFLLAPVAFFAHTWGPMAAARDAFPALAHARLMGEVLPRGSSALCKDAVPLCGAVSNAAGGGSPHEFNATLFRILMGHYPSGASYGQLLHYFQVMVTGEFKKYDYGHKDNVARYGRPTPPPFDLSNVVAPVYLNYADGDPFSPAKDVKRLAKEVPGVKRMMHVPLKDFGHTDHLYAIHSYDLEYKHIIQEMLDSLRS